jgi:hypothetical protein
MMDGVPYFCFSHLLSLITVAPATATPNPAVFNELAVPPSPLYLDRVLTPADVAAARQLIALVSWQPDTNGSQECCSWTCHVRVCKYTCS